MNILVVSFNIPRPGSGASTRNYQLLKALAKHHQVALVAFNDAPEADREEAEALLRALAHTVRVVELPARGAKRFAQAAALVTLRSYRIAANTSPQMQSAINVLCAQQAYDLVLFESVQMAGYQVPAGTSVVIDEHNIEYELLRRAAAQETSLTRRAYNHFEYRLLKPRELARCRQANAVCVTSERERDILAPQLRGTPVVVVPNGVDLEMFQRTPVEQQVPGRIIFTGALTYHPNVQAVLHFAQHCWPRVREQMSAATWDIVGRYPPPEVLRLAEMPGVRITGAVPDVRPYLAQAQVAIAPLLVGSGTRLKILESFATGKAVVSTSLGAEGLQVVPGEHLMLADDPTAFATAVVTLLRNPALRAAYGAAGHALVRARFSWEASGAALLGALACLVEGERMSV